MHEDTHIDHKLSSSTTVKTLFTHDSLYFHMCGVTPTNKINYLGFPGGESSISHITRGYDPALSPFLS